MEKKVINVIENIRPYLRSDGGDIEFIELKDNKVYVKVTGHCVNCHMLEITMKELVEQAIKNEIPEIEEVINVGRK